MILDQKRYLKLREKQRCPVCEKKKVLIPTNYRCSEDNPKKIKMMITMEKKKQSEHCKALNHSRSDFCLECGSPLPFR